MRCSLATTNGRVELPFTVSEHLKQYLGYRTCSADLCFRKGHFTLHVVVSLPKPEIAHQETVIGIDLGRAHPAVTSELVFLGERRWQEQERKLFRLRRTLQHCGTKSAKRHLKKLSGKRFRQRKDHDHVLSKRIVQNAPQGSTLVFENLKDIRATSQIGRGRGNKNALTKRRFHSWSFAQLHSFVCYKAAWKGMEVVKVTLDIPLRPVADVGNNTVRTAVPKVCLSAMHAATPSMQITMLPLIFVTSIYVSCQSWYILD